MGFYLGHLVVSSCRVFSKLLCSRFLFDGPLVRCGFRLCSAIEPECFVVSMLNRSADHLRIWPRVSFCLVGFADAIS